MAQKHGHYCPFCGMKYDKPEVWPRTCGTCDQTTYRNPLPVAILVVPVDLDQGRHGILTVRRAFGPKRGYLALPGGFIEVDETWQEAAVRETFEETSVTIAADTVTHVETVSAPDGTVLIFGKTDPIDPSRLSSFTERPEVSELAILDALADDIAFDLHARVIAVELERS